jgi:hypothetical protein
MVSGYDFFTGPWQNTEWLVTETHRYYDENVTNRGLGTIWEVTKKKIIERRKWTPSLAYYDTHFTQILEELGILYVPKQVDPGPCVLFPQPDYHSRLTHGKIYPFYELMLRSGAAKYGFLGKKDSIRGPVWLGNSDQVLQLIAKYRTVVLVEGPFDLLACRLLWPNAAVMSTGTKSINEAHVQYLRMLGVKTVYLLFDYETAKEGKSEGAGEVAMSIIRNTWGQKSGIRFEIANCPNDDPSMCLEDYYAAKKLRDVLIGIFPQ